MAKENSVWRDNAGQTFTPATPPGTETNARTQLETDVDLTTHVVNDNSTRVRKVLGQLKPAATTLTAFYTVPAATETEVSTIYITETNGVATTFRISIAVAGLADTAKQYIFRDAPVDANETIQLNDCGILLAATDVIRVYAGTADVVFNAFGTQVT